MADNGRSTISHENSPNAGPSYSAQEDDVDTRPVAAAAAVQCLRTVDRRCTGEIDTADATIQFHRILPDDERGNAALRRYIEMCTELDVERATAAVRGGAPIGGEPTSSVQPSANHRTQLTDVERATTTVRDQAPLSGEPTSSDCPLVNRRARRTSHSEAQARTCRERELVQNTSEEGGSEPDSDSVISIRKLKRRHSDSDASDSAARSKKRPNKAKFSWRQRQRDPFHASADLAKTLSLEANHLRDLKAARDDLISQIDCPNFPDSLWLDVLVNRFIDLDCVFSGYYSLESEQKVTESIGNIDITLLAGGGSRAPSKSIESHGDWSITFAAAKQAILYVYPHRTEELAEYEQYIIGLFAALRHTTLHQRVINLDKAIQVRVAKDNRLFRDAHRPYYGHGRIMYGELTDTADRMIETSSL